MYQRQANIERTVYKLGEYHNIGYESSDRTGNTIIKIVNILFATSMIPEPSFFISTQFIDMRYRHQNYDKTQSYLKKLTKYHMFEFVKSSDQTQIKELPEIHRKLYLHMKGFASGNILSQLSIFHSDTHLPLIIYFLKRQETTWLETLLRYNKILKSWFMLENDFKGVANIRENCQLILYVDEGQLRYILDDEQLNYIESEENRFLRFVTNITVKDEKACTNQYAK